MKIAMLPGSISRKAGGLFTSVRRLSESVRDYGMVDVDVIGNHDDSTEEDVAQWQKPPKLISGDGLRSRSKQTLTQLNSLAPDIVHPQFLWSYGSMATVRYYRTTKTPYVISPRGMLDPWAVNHHWWRKRIASRWFESKHLKNASCMHALCDAEADAIRTYGLSNRIEVIPNGIDLPPELNLKQERSSNDRTLLFLGRLHEKKGVHHLLDAWATMNGRERDLENKIWNLVIAGFGDTAYEDRLRRMISERGLDQSVRMIGPVVGENKSEVLGSADAFILPSYSEGLPMSILEAWAYRLPVLMTGFCNLPIGIDRGAAIPIDPTAESIKTTLIDFFRLSDVQRLKIGEAGRKLVGEKFQWSAIASEMTSLYTNLSASSP